MNDLSVRQMARLLKKISLRDNDIILVKNDKFEPQEILDALKRGIERINLTRVIVVMVEDFNDITTLNRQQMNSHGWYHVSQINRLTDKVRRG